MLSMIERLFWSLFWLFLLLIIGFFVLNLIQNKADGNPLGRAAGWIKAKAEGN